MGKSLRNKKKVAARTQKRTDSFYAVHHAARLQRISSKLQSGGGDAEVKEDEMKVDGEPVKGEDVENKEGDEKAQAVKTEDDAEMDSNTPKKISTSGPRLNRREEWRMAKGLSIRPDSKGLNNMGTAKARRKSGRSARRR